MNLFEAPPDPSQRNLTHPDSKDRAMRAIADDGSFRVIALRATETVRGATFAQGATGETARHLAELLVASVLIRETMSPGQRVQAVLGGRGSVAADAWPSGMTRGLARVPEADPHFDLRLGGSLQVMRARYDGGLQQGFLDVEAERGIQGALEDYMIKSEQVESWLALRCAMEGDEIIEAGGYLIQRLPEAHQAQIDAMAQHHATADALGEGWLRDEGDPGLLIKRLLGDMLWHQLGDSPVFFGCNCGEDRVLGMIATLGRAEIQSLIDDGKALDIDCDYCSVSYNIGVQRLKALLNDQ
jgi:molecular chaperone Hsp33